MGLRVIMKLSEDKPHYLLKKLIEQTHDLLRVVIAGKAVKNCPACSSGRDYILGPKLHQVL